MLPKFNELCEKKKTEKVYEQDEMKEKFLSSITEIGNTYKKKTQVLVRIATEEEKIITTTSTGKETECVAKVGDFIVQNKTGAKEEYVLPPEKFNKRYEKTEETENGLDVYQATGMCKALTFEGAEWNMPNKIKFIADWKEEMVMEDGDMVCTPLPAANEIYRIARKEFDETYAIYEPEEETINN